MKIATSGDDERARRGTEMGTSTSHRDVTWLREDAAALTIHGVRHFVQNGRPWYLRVLWLFVWLGTLGVFVWMYTEVVIDLNRYPFNTINQAWPQSFLQFPAITICNLNSLDVVNVSYAKELKELIASTAFDSKMPTINVSSEHQQLLNMSSKTVLDDTAPKFEQVFGICQYDDKTFDCSELFQLTYRGMTRCYTLNQSMLWPATFVTSLRLVINVNQAGYVVQSDKSAGVKFYIHSPEDIPNVNLRGTVASPGFSTRVAMTLQEFHFLPEPFKAFGDQYCVYTDTDDFKKTRKIKEYHTSSCFMTRSMEQACITCNCSAPYSESPFPVCTVYEMYYCLLPALRSMNENMLNMSEELDCPRPCNYQTYHRSISFSYFPSDAAHEELERVHLLDFVNGTARPNLLELIFYYDDLIIFETKHVEQYTAKSLVGTIGGNMGFFLGASILSVGEVLELVLEMCLVLYRRLTAPRQNRNPHRREEVHEIRNLDNGQ